MSLNTSFELLYSFLASIFFAEDQGQALAEYVLVILLVSVVMVVFLGVLGQDILGLITLALDFFLDRA